jgi:hypothetical protein
VTINAQLREFYSRQGLTGKHLRSALKHDRRRIREEVTKHQLGWPRYERYDPEYLSEAFAWAGTREGAGYWAARCVYLSSAGRRYFAPAG